jgi:hypothetical protein
MSKKSEALKIKKLEKRWARSMRGFDHFWKATKKELKLQMEVEPEYINIDTTIII